MSPLSVSGITDVGLRRTNNEDAFALLPETGVFAVADGIGGAEMGEVASAIFVEAACRAAAAGGPASETEAAELIRGVFREANQAILAVALEDAGRAGMGCTAEVAMFIRNRFVVGHVGDSRTYLFAGGRLRRITRDHSPVQDQIDAGLLTEEAARNHPLRHMISRAVGTAEGAEPDISGGALGAGEALLLCSDGLVDMVDDAGIESVLAAPGTPEQKVARLVALANERGGSDNVTVVLCEWSDI
jgi:protein phosphatase